MSAMATVLVFLASFLSVVPGAGRIAGPLFIVGMWMAYSG